MIDLVDSAIQRLNNRGLVYPMIGHYFVIGYFNTYFSHLASRMLSFTYMSRTETLPHCTFWCFDLWHFDRRKGFLGTGQGGVWIKVFEKMITGSLLLFSHWFFIISYFTAHLFYLFIGTDQGPGIGYILSFEDSKLYSWWTSYFFPDFHQQMASYFFLMLEVASIHLLLITILIHLP